MYWFNIMNVKGVFIELYTLGDFGECLFIIFSADCRLVHILYCLVLLRWLYETAFYNTEYSDALTGHEIVISVLYTDVSQWKSYIT